MIGMFGFSKIYITPRMVIQCLMDYPIRKQNTRVLHYPDGMIQCVEVFSNGVVNKLFFGK